MRLHDYGCTLKAYRREVLDEIRLYGEMHRFIPAYAAMVGAAIAELPVAHHPRVRGKSKYGLGRIYRVILDLLTVKFLGSYATKPLYLFGRFSLAIFSLAGLLATIMLLLRIVSGFFFVNSLLLIVTGVLVLIGSQTILMGLLAEINMRTYHESQRKPTYVVRQRLGFQLMPLPQCVEETVQPPANDADALPKWWPDVRIAGFAFDRRPGTERAQVLDDMCATLYRRGPDSGGAMITPEIALGMRRLSIIDLASGDQPLYNEIAQSPSSATVRSTTRPSCAPASNRPDTCSAPTATAKRSCTATRSGAKTSSAGSTACLPLPCGTSASGS